ncbi:MAG: DEAD/DEAH box helicase, partial [Flavipsychrobacter sp.]
MKFEDYHISADIKRSLEELGFKRPTDIQFKAIPSILKGDDLLAIAQKGTCKTEDFAITVLHLLQQRERRNKNGTVSC